MSPAEARLVRNTILTVVALVLLRLVGAAWTPLTFDEAYYWIWSKNLAFGYYDHPPGVALVIRLGTMIAGDTELGVRLVSILLALPMSYAVYRTAEILFGGRKLAANATILLNVTLMAAVGTLIVTPDSPLLVASSFVLFFLAKVLESGRGAWWLAVGAAAGAALVSKYTAMFFGPAILIWLIRVPKLRPWLLSPWLYLGGLVALIVFSPVILWNADHGWISFIKQLGRGEVVSFRLSFIGELIPTQIAFATPLVFILGAMGLYALMRREGGALASRALISAMFWIITLYFLWHSLHARVEANWFAPVYPALAIAAEIEATRARVGASCVLAPDYGTASWLTFYLPKDTCVVQPTQRIRWVNMAEPDPAKLSGKLLWVDEVRANLQPYVTDTFATIKRVGEFKRMRGPLVIETYGLDLVDGAKQRVLENSPPPARHSQVCSLV